MRSIAKKFSITTNKKFEELKITDVINSLSEILYVQLLDIDSKILYDDEQIKSIDFSEFQEQKINSICGYFIKGKQVIGQTRPELYFELILMKCDKPNKISCDFVYKGGNRGEVKKLIQQLDKLYNSELSDVLN